MSHLPTDAKARKDAPMARGVLDYFPRALAAIAEVSRVGNEQHNPGQPMHWAKEKSTDHADCILRHLVDRGEHDVDGLRHSAKVAWRALALLETELQTAEVHATAEAKFDTYGTRPWQEQVCGLPLCDCAFPCIFIEPPHGHRCKARK